MFEYHVNPIRCYLARTDHQSSRPSTGLGHHSSGEGGATDRRGVSWSDQKLLFGGEPIQAGQSKSFAKTNETIQPKAPIFVTCQGELFHPDPKERRAMNRRFRRFTFFASIPEGEVKEIPACPKCFAHFVLQVEVPQCIEEHR